ncbi:MAG: threonine/serine dehydratase [Pirellulales bacterium]
MLELSHIQAAKQTTLGRVHRTPLIRSQSLSTRWNTNVYLKLECLQKTGSFKPRGAFNKLLQLSEAERAKGVVGVSGGNHAQGLAYAARSLSVSAVICMPETTPKNYLDATRDYGAEIRLFPTIHAAFEGAAKLQSEGRVYVHPFDDQLVAAGQGTVGLEIAEDLPQITKCYISIGGGALIGGMATAIKSMSPKCRIIGVETEGADVMARTVAANELVTMPAITSIARTLGSPSACPFTWDMVKRLVDELVVVSDADSVRELFYILERAKILIEPAAACCLAAAEQHASQFRPTDHVVILLCGGNVSAGDLCSWRQQFVL